MSTRIIGRENEQAKLGKLLDSTTPEFLALYGRRRVGKTHLVREYFSNNKSIIYFDAAGIYKTPMLEQISSFIARVGSVFYGGASLAGAKNWLVAFEMLTKAMDSSPDNKKIVLFFDEFPWMATKNSRILSALEYYWNQFWSKDNRIKLIICGSSASWIIKNIINNKGGLHNRLTEEMLLETLSLNETEHFLRKQGIKLNKQQIVEIYMAIGGIPHYLMRIEKGLSATQAIEQLAFRKNSFLLLEFEKLFSSLFEDSELYINIVRAIATKRQGLTLAEMIKIVPGLSSGGQAKRVLHSLEDAGFILKFKPYQHKEKGIYYRVIDEYILFYLDWIEPIKDSLQARALRPGYWEGLKQSASWHSWAGYAFEAICYKHLPQISIALQLSPTALAQSWRYIPRKGSKEDGAQIDLLFVRRDAAITICEIKYTAQPFVLDKANAKNLQNKVKVFVDKTGAKQQMFIALISANGVKPSMYSEELVSQVITLKDLFNS